MTGVIRARLWLLIAGLALLGMAVMAFRGAQGTVVVSLTDAAGAVERPDAAVQEAETAAVSASGPVAAAGAEPALDGPSRRCRLPGFWCTWRAPWPTRASTSLTWAQG